MKKFKNLDGITDPDPLDGLKAIGCLFAGIILIAIFVSVSSWIIHLIR